MKPTLAILPATLIAITAFAQEKPAQPAPPEFKPLVERIDLKDGDSLVFLGDSITHQCLYTQYVEDFFYTRYPKMRIHFHNAGVGGDKAKDALTRFDEDVAPYKPKYVTILLGMNDGSYRDFDKPIFDTYTAGMTTILDKIAALGAIAVPMTPTMFDARAKRLRNDNVEPRNTLYNGVLSLYGTWLREQAETRGLGFVDMWSPLNNLTMEQRKKTPNFTMIPDGVHPGPAGQVIMAAAVLEDIVPRSAVSQIVIEEKGGKLAARATAGTIADFEPGEKISFTFTAQRLPWVLPPEAAEGYKLAHAGHKLSNEKLTIRGLKAGNYELKIDGQPVGVYAAGQLATGVELEENDKTPEYQQALKVAMLNKQRNDQAYHPLRDQYAQLKGKRRDLQKAIDTNAPDIEQKKADFETWYTAQKAKVAELLAQARAVEDQIYAAAQPVAHKYEITPQ
jgi:lysophospholipase L1-like esterase